MYGKEDLDKCTAEPTAAGYPGACIGRLVALDANGAPLVDFPGAEGEPGQSRGPRLALLGAPWPHGPLASAVGCRVVLVFEDGRGDRPVIVGWVEEHEPATAPAPRHVRIDGEQIVIEGRRRIELRCGKTSLVLTADGNAMIKGTNVLTEARELLRLRGAAVRIN